ncbi:hypothetical protein Bpfe_006603, partial [Biomphalaria pfeifferi]
SALAFVVVSLVAVSMYKAPFISSILSGLVTFMVYVRDASSDIRKKHERCLKIITENILAYISAENMERSETHLHFYKTTTHVIEHKKDQKLLTVKGAIPFIICSSKIYVKDSIISHFLKFRIEK